MTIELALKHDNPQIGRAIVVSHVTGRPGDTGIVIKPLVIIEPGHEVHLVVYHGMHLAIAEHDPLAAVGAAPVAGGAPIAGNADQAA